MGAYYHFVGHYRALCGLKWRVWWAEMYFLSQTSKQTQWKNVTDIHST